MTPLRFPPSPRSESTPTPTFRFPSATRTLLAALALAGGLFSATPAAQAQSVSTDPVGAVSSTLGVGVNSVSLSLHNPDIVSAQVVGFTSPNATISTTFSKNLLEPNSSYYIEVYSGDLKGDRFEVNVSPTISAANNIITIDLLSSRNSIDSAALQSGITGATIRLRKHITIEQIKEMSSGTWTGNANPSLADQILLFDSSTNSYIVHFLRADTVTWRQLGTTRTSNKDVIEPGTGLFVRKHSGTATLTHVGNVRNNDFVQKYTSGLQLLSSPWPIDLSPSQIRTISSIGWVGNNNPALADQIQVFNRNTNSYDIFFLRTDGAWRRLGTTTVVTDAKVIPSTNSFFIKRANNEQGVLYLNPLSL